MKRYICQLSFPSHLIDLASVQIFKLSLFSEYGKCLLLNMTSFRDTFLEEGAAERIQRRGLGFVFKRGFVSEIERLNLGLKTVGKCQFLVITAASLYISVQILCLDHQIFMTKPGVLYQIELLLLAKNLVHIGRLRLFQQIVP